MFDELGIYVMLAVIIGAARMLTAKLNHHQSTNSLTALTALAMWVINLAVATTDVIRHWAGVHIPSANLLIELAFTVAFMLMACARVNTRHYATVRI